MRALLSTCWTLVPAGPATLEHRCPQCEQQTSFEPTGRFRVNAQGRRLDVWLLLACTRCGMGWKAWVHRRVPVADLPPERLAAFERNDPATVAAVAVAMGGAGVERVDGEVPDPPFIVTLRRPAGSRQRLDRLLAGKLGLSRKQVHAAWARGAIRGVPDTPKAIRLAVRDGQVLWVGDV